MGLDATVYCNCFETGKFRGLPPHHAEVRVKKDGSLACYFHDIENNLDKEINCDKWLHDESCEHEGNTLLHHYIGNISIVGLLRFELSRAAELFPLLLNKVVYNGVHCGDWLTVEEVAKLGDELKLLENFKGSDKQADLYLKHFHKQMTELSDAALQVQKPISF